MKIIGIFMRVKYSKKLKELKLEIAELNKQYKRLMDESIEEVMGLNRTEEVKRLESERMMNLCRRIDLRALEHVLLMKTNGA